MDKLKTFNGLPLITAEMIEGKFTHGVNFISLVERPATKQPVFFFSDQEEEDQGTMFEGEMKFGVASEEKGLIEGVLMLADTPIKRIVNGKEFYLEFPRSLVEKMSFKFMQNLFGRNVNVEHNPEQKAPDVYVVESWLFDPERGRSLPAHFDTEEVTPGSWIVTMKVDDEQIRQDIKNKKIVGYSLEGDFGLKVNFSENFVGIEKDIILDAEISINDKFNHIQKTVGGVK